MPNSTTPASRAARLTATRRQEAKRKEEGWRKVTVWLPPDAVARLDRLAEWHGGIGAAIEAALKAGETVEGCRLEQSERLEIK